MDTTLTSLSSEAGAILLANMEIVEVVSMFSIGAYNALETAIVTFNVFDRYRGLYFWSMQVASWGIVLHSISAMVRFVSQASGLAMSIPFLRMRWALWMIVINAVVLHIPMSILFLGIGQGNTHFARAAAIYDRIQLTGFCIQDLVLCGTYIRKAARIMKPIMALRDCAERRIMVHLVMVNAFVLVLNLLLVIAEYKIHFIQISLKTVVYSIKLKLEFTVLNRLRSLVKSDLSNELESPTSRHFSHRNHSSGATSLHAKFSRVVKDSAPFLDVEIPDSLLWLDLGSSSPQELLEASHIFFARNENMSVSAGCIGGEGWVRGPTGKFTEDLDDCRKMSFVE
ncbi:hypothetical protein N7478_010727 [Penicillium angulare]|uniref:uncharacterized protein n=1 Tax=Penicillium angulare TaxID=116970 RepID=UPI002540A0FF|nr:uncharacterized protein N7478_010727 [Penicillium angulare]KAJ5267919.1 hypothetical protein N7478_010727 [Penicillium angulare]